MWAVEPGRKGASASSGCSDPPWVSGTVQQRPGLGGEETNKKCRIVTPELEEDIVPLSLLANIHHVSIVSPRSCPNASLTRVHSEVETVCHLPFKNNGLLLPEQDSVSLRSRPKRA